MKGKPNVPLHIQEWLFWGGCALFLICFFLLLFCSCNPIEWMYDKADIPHDNVAEEILEFVIEKKTGIDIDLTNSSPE